MLRLNFRPNFHADTKNSPIIKSASEKDSLIMRASLILAESRQDQQQITELRGQVVSAFRSAHLQR
jgi:hypothetical protein